MHRSILSFRPRLVRLIDCVTQGSTQFLAEKADSRAHNEKGIFQIMPANWSVTFLGTCSGGGPTRTRNCSSLVLNLGIRGAPLWSKSV
jgi:hypothetical protein